MNTEKANRSVYLIDIKLDNEKSMLIHGYTGAIDIVSNELADYLKNNPCISTHDFPFSNNTLNSLLNRGYLTTKTKEEEYSVTSKIANLLHDAHKRMYKSFAFIITYNCNFRCLIVLKIVFPATAMLGLKKSSHLKWQIKPMKQCLK